jgi:hypothetical protein
MSHRTRTTTLTRVESMREASVMQAQGCKSCLDGTKELESTDTAGMMRSVCVVRSQFDKCDAMVAFRPGFRGIDVAHNDAPKMCYHTSKTLFERASGAERGVRAVRSWRVILTRGKKRRKASQSNKRQPKTNDSAQASPARVFINRSTLHPRHLRRTATSCSSC